jgi:NADH-quinone oxidoreductase subunit G
VLVGLEPEDEAGTVFLRLRKAARGRLMPIYSIAPYTSRGLHKMTGTLIPTRPGEETAALDALPIGKAGVQGLDDRHSRELAIVDDQ